MGYSTYFTLDYDDELRCPTCGTCGVVTHEDQIIEQIGYNPFEGECKWYSHEQDMKEYSENAPDVLFTLNGEGEESGDVWVQYFKAGKCQTEKAKIQLAPFDETKLT